MSGVKSFFVDISTNKQYREQFKKDPKGFLKQNNIPYSDLREIKIVEDSDDKKYFAIRTPEDIKKTLEEAPNLPENQKEFFKQLAQSKEFREKFKANPQSVLNSLNMELHYRKIEVVEDSDKVCYWILPVYQEINEDELAQIAGGRDYLGDALKDWAPDKGRAFATGFFFPVTFPAIGLQIGANWLIDKITGK